MLSPTSLVCAVVGSVCHDISDMRHAVLIYAENRPHKVYALLSPQIKYISQDVVQSKWKALPKSTEDNVKELFRSIERPVLASYVGKSRKIDAQQAIASIAGT